MEEMNCEENSTFWSLERYTVVKGSTLWSVWWICYIFVIVTKYLTEMIFWNEGLFLASGSWDTVHHRKEDMPAGVMVGLWWSDCVTHFFISWWIRVQKAWKKWYNSTWRPTSGDLLTVFASCPNSLKSPQTVLQTGTKCFNTQACGEHFPLNRHTQE